MMPMENYLIQRIVGRGAFGTAFLCKSQNERTMNKDVIIKQIPIEQMSTLDRQVLSPLLNHSFLYSHLNICLKNTQNVAFQFLDFGFSTY